MFDKVGTTAEKAHHLRSAKCYPEDGIHSMPSLLDLMGWANGKIGP